MDENMKKSRSGGFGFTAFALLFGLAALFASLLLLRDHPGVDGPAILPLITSALLVVCSAAELVREALNAAKKDDKLSFSARIAALFNTDLIVTAASVAVYGLLLLVGVWFYLVTPIFLFGLMSYLCRGKYIRNLIITASSVAALWLLFDLLLNVPL